MGYVLQPSILMFNSLGPTLDPELYIQKDISITIEKETVPRLDRVFPNNQGGTGTGIIVPTTGQLWPLGDLM